MNTFGKYITLTTFGESHGPAMGGILDGMPSLVKIDLAEIDRQTERRAPGRSALTSQRREPDKAEILSGITADGLTLGTPIGFIVRNRDARSGDYAGYQGRFRPNHADYTYYTKYGINDFRGGGRASARETVSWVIGGAIVRQWLSAMGIEIAAEFIETNSVEDAKNSLDSTGGAVRCVISGMPAGIGEPVFEKLHSRLAAAMMGINAAKAFEYGDGRDMSAMRGSECLDLFGEEIEGRPGVYRFLTNHSGGILGGISNGMPINFTVYFKPTPTIMQDVPSVDTDGNRVVINPKGRHDPCVAMRAVPVVEAMAALTVADMIKGASRKGSQY